METYSLKKYSKNTKLISSTFISVNAYFSLRLIVISHQKRALLFCIGALEAQVEATNWTMEPKMK